MHETTTRRPRGSLTRDEVVDVALELVRTDGVESLTMRRLAERLGVNPMTLYLRVENKDALLGAMVTRRLSEVRTVDAGGSIEDRLVAWSRSVREQLGGVGDLLAAIRPSAHLITPMLDGTETGLALLTDAGFTGQAAVDAFRSLFWHAVAFASLGPSLHAHAPELLRDAELSAEAHPRLVELHSHLDEFDPDALVERTTRALVRGLLQSLPNVPDPDPRTTSTPLTTRTRSRRST